MTTDQENKSLVQSEALTAEEQFYLKQNITDDGETPSGENATVVEKRDVYYLQLANRLNPGDMIDYTTEPMTEEEVIAYIRDNYLPSQLVDFHSYTTMVVYQDITNGVNKYEPILTFIMGIDDQDHPELKIRHHIHYLYVYRYPKNKRRCCCFF